MESHVVAEGGPRRIRGGVIAALFSSAVLGLSFASSALAAPLAPQTITVTAHSSFIDLAWAASEEPETPYSVWRSAVVGDTVLTAKVVGFASTNSFIDSTAIVGARYRYAVVELGDAARFPETASFTGVHSLATVDPGSLSPHRTTGSTALDITCARCHSVSESTSEVGLLIDHNGPYTSQAVMCTGCHAHAAVRTGFEDGLSGHMLALAQDPESGSSALACSQCHDAHGKTSDGDALSPDRIRRPDGSLVDVVWVDPVTHAYLPNALCVACHEAPTTASDFRPTFDPRYYPVSGTYPGATIFADPARNVHAALIDPDAAPGPISKSPGSCTYCHGPHRTSSPNDGLLVVGEASTPAAPNAASGDVAPLCATCHTWVLPSAEATDTATWGVHRVSTPGGVFEPGTSIPCYICHNPHGSSRGNALNIADSLGANLDPRVDGRAFCTSCHTTSDGLGWDSGTSGFVAPVVDEFLGYSRTALEPGGATGVVSKLRLKPIGSGAAVDDVHSSSYAGNADCLSCHGDTHGPTKPDIAEIDCLSCHSDLIRMDRRTASRADTYHHILGDGASYSGGTPIAGYLPPTPPGNVKSCLTCHTGHSSLDGHIAQNLRTAPANATPAASDFLGSGSSPGICMSCHQTAQVRNPRAVSDQRRAFVRVPSGSEVNTVRPLSATNYAASSHNFNVVSGTGASGNCIKCHAQGPERDGSSLASYAVHESPNRFLIGAIGNDDFESSGLWNTTPGEYRLCFRCHARAGDIAPATPVGKDLADRDWFNVKSMGQRAVTYRNQGGGTVGTRTFIPQRVFFDMYRSTGIDLANPIVGRATSGHWSEKVVSPTNTRFTTAFRTSTTSVRCSDCHEVHRNSTFATSLKGEWPLTKKAVPPGYTALANWGSRVDTKGYSYTGGVKDSRLITLNDYWHAPATNPVDILCFRCHEKSVWAAKVPHAASEAGNYSAHAGMQGADHKNSHIACISCHVPAVHGSGMPYLLADATDGVMTPHVPMQWYTRASTLLPSFRS